MCESTGLTLFTYVFCLIGHHLQTCAFGLLPSLLPEHRHLGEAVLDEIFGIAVRRQVSPDPDVVVDCLIGY